MGASSGGKGKKTKMSRNKERANMSFFIVVMFFAVFGIIVFTEIFLIDERGHGAGVVVRHGSLGSGRHRFGDKADYEDVLQNDDYLALRGGFGGFDDNLGAMLREARGESAAGVKLPAAASVERLPVLSEGELPKLPVGQPIAQAVEAQLPPYKYFVFSAFHDRRKGQQAVRLIGATKTRGPERVWCRLWYRMPENSSTGNSNSDWISVSVMAKVKVIRENWNLKYSACFILCPLHKNMTAPETVSVVSRIRSPPSNLVVVRNTDKDRDVINFTKIPEGIAICVKPFHFNYNRALQLLEFIELNMILGVQHFTFYNHTIGKEVDCILRDYIAKGIVTMLPWKLNMASQKEIRTEGLFAALNDCLYRSMYRYSHVALVDLDEYIIPRHNDTLPQLLKWLGTRLNTRTTGSYSFQNAFFYLQWGDDPSILQTTNSIESGLVTLRKTRRRAKLHPHKQRSKYICRPEFIVEAGNHFVWEFIPGHGTLNVPADAAILHHYRVCEFGGDDCVKTASTVDAMAYRYKERLISRVSDHFYQMKQTCQLLDLPPPPRKNTTPKPKVVRIFSNAKDFNFLNFNAKSKAS
ncbi:uncharacterized protein CBL_14446 [Carabus blaptoides fortunei]